MQVRSNPALIDFWLAGGYRNKVLPGGRASGKSWSAADHAIGLAQLCRLRFMCTRQFQNKIDESVYTLLKLRIEQRGLEDDFEFLAKSIRHRYTGTEFLFYGLARNINEVKSTEDIDILWIEEAQSLTAEQWRVLEPTIRKEGSEVWVIFNPQFASDFAYERFVANPPPNTLVREINYDENPFISNTMRNIINAARVEDYDEYLHIYRGVPRNDDDRVIIKRSWIEAAIGANERLGIEPSGQRITSYDVADSGNDKNAMIHRYGFHVNGSDLWKGGDDELIQSTKRVWLSAKEFNADVIRYDGIGVGAYVGSYLKEAGCTSRVDKFMAGGAVFKPDDNYISGAGQRIKNRDFFSNIKAQAWWLVADRFRHTYNCVVHGNEPDENMLVSIDPKLKHLDILKKELSTPFRHLDMNGKVKVESKDDLLKRGVKSPNLADAFIQAFAPTAKLVLI